VIPQLRIDPCSLCKSKARQLWQDLRILPVDDWADSDQRLRVSHTSIQFRMTLHRHRRGVPNGWPSLPYLSSRMLSMPLANQGSRDTQSSVAEGPVFPPGTAMGLRLSGTRRKLGDFKGPWRDPASHLVVVYCAVLKLATEVDAFACRVSA
jgi:hypothetical protein